MKNNTEIEINARLLEAINNSPSDYDLFLEQWDSSKEKYINDLEKVFDQFIRQNEKEYNTFDYIVHAIQRWYLQLPKYVKEIRNEYVGDGRHEPVDISAVRFLNSLRVTEINARDFLFNKMLWFFDEDTFSPQLSNSISNLKDYIDSIKEKLIQKLSLDLKCIIGSNNTSPEATLSSVVKDWLNGLDDNVKTHMFNNSDSALLDLCLSITPDTGKFVEDIARASTGLRIDDWGEITIDGFLRVIREFVKTINNYNSRLKKSEKGVIAGSYKISYIDDSGNETFKTFDKSELSDVANLLFNDVEAMITEEYGDSLSTSEKRQVLITIIEKLLS